MKTSIKALTLAALAVLAGAPAVRAADDSVTPPPPQHERPHMKEMRARRMKELDEKLHLTAEQKTQIKQIWDKAGQQMRAERQAAAKANNDRREKVRDGFKAANQEVRAVLTPEQQKIFDEMPQHSGPPAGARGPGRPPKDDGQG